MTSLIDVIFILLLFFLLTSTFTRFGELNIASGGASGAALIGDAPIFLRLEADNLTVNGTRHTLDSVLPALRSFAPEEGEVAPVLIAVDRDVTSQQLVNLLVILHPLDWADVSVLG